MFIKIKVTPAAKKEKVTRISETLYEILVREPAERNLANTRVREIIAQAAGVPIGKTKIVSGHRSMSKIMSIDI